MIFHALNALVAKPPGFPLPAPLFGAGGFACGAVGAQAAVIPSVMPGGMYAGLPVSPAFLIWDALTVGYGGLGEMAVLTGGNAVAAKRVRQFASSRARLLRIIYDWPIAAVPGPVLRAEYEFVETSERRLISFLIGQTVAQTLAKAIWGVPRLFHRSLYGPRLPALVPGLPALPAGQSPDYLCLAPVGAPVPGFGLVEAKGTNTKFNPETVAKHRNSLDHAFTQLAAVAGAWQSAVSVAAFDAALLPNTIAGQFWDPPNPDALPVSEEGSARLTAEYFRRLYSLLGCLAEPDDKAMPGAMVWDAKSVGIRVSMDISQWKLLRQLRRGQINDHEFFREISTILDRKDQVRGIETNEDGLHLELVEFD